MIELNMGSPFRPPDWRWKRTNALIAAGKSFFRKKEDEAILMCRDFIRDLDKGNEDPWRKELVYQRWKSIYEAYLIWTQDGKHRAELEARLLCNIRFSEVAKHCSIDKETAQFYEALFFNVTDRLDQISWVSHYVIGEKLYTGFANNDHKLIWKIFAYAGGHHVFQSIFEMFPGDFRPASKDEVDVFFDKQASSFMKRKALQNIMTLQTNDPYSKLQLSQIHLEFLKLEHEFNQGSSADVLTKSLEKAFSNLIIGVGKEGRGDDRRELPILGPAEEVDLGAIEQRSSSRIAKVMDEAKQIVLPAPEYPR